MNNVTRVSVADLEIHPVNARIYGPHDERLKDNLEQFGLLVPIKVNTDGQILSGGRRWMAARALGWSQIEAELVEPENPKKFILLTNKYRGNKPPAMMAREADAYRELLDKGEVTKDELAEMAGEKGRASRYAGREKKPSELAASAAGMGATTYEAASYVLDPDRGERKIDEAKERGEISSSDAGVLKRKIREDREKLERDKVSPTSAGRGARQRLRDRVEEHTKSEQERRQDAADRAVSEIVSEGQRLADRIARALDQHGEYVGPSHLVRITAKLTEAYSTIQQFASDEGVVQVVEAESELLEEAV